MWILVVIYIISKQQHKRIYNGKEDIHTNNIIHVNDIVNKIVK